MDRAIWATWYDLPEDGRDEYLAWLHGKHLPAMLKRPGYLWGTHVQNVDIPEREEFSARVLTHTDDPSVPAGFHYLVLFGAEDAHVFLDPAPEELEASLPEEDRRMLGLRAGVRSAVFVEIARVEALGSGKNGPGITPGPVIQVGTFNLKDWSTEGELSTWYSRLTFPLLKPLGDTMGARRLVSVHGWPRHAIFYEFATMEAAAEFFNVQGRNRQPWNFQVVGNLIHAPHSPTLGQRIWP
jgi:hypothetical protein